MNIPVTLGLFVHVGVVRLPLYTKVKEAITHLVHLDLLVGPVELQPVLRGAGARSGHLGNNGDNYWYHYIFLPKISQY